MRRGEETRTRIVDIAAQEFGKRGYRATSTANLLRATDLQKGGLYNHFDSKDTLSLAAFDRSAELVSERLLSSTPADAAPLEKIRALIDSFVELAANSPIPGGCPVVNVTVECRDADQSELLTHARTTMDLWLTYIDQLLHQAIEQKQLSPELDTKEFTTVAISLLEGALLLSRLYNDNLYLKHAATHVNSMLEKHIL